ncbi:MAG: hypothetical protein IKQ80_04100 [Clostridia bacterium]|nr:hypothetical protein [Clostridia bacterium]
MNLKKFAIRGIVILAVFVALCMFFSGTVRTITTPKVRLTSARRGKLEERVELPCKVAFPDTEKVDLPLPDDTMLVITRVNSREGYTVQAGEVVIEAKVSGYETQYKTLQEAYDSASEQLMTLENKNRGIRISPRDQAYADAFFALRDARRAAVAARLDMEAQLSREGLGAVDTGYPEGASDELKELIDASRAAAAAQEAAQKAMDAAARYTVDDSVWSYITEQREQQQKRDDAEESLRRLMALNDQAKAVVAPHDGYIAEICVKEGDTCDGSQPLFRMTAEEGMPTLRGDISEVTRTVSEGMTVTLNPDSYDAVETKVVKVGTDTEGKKYADVALTNELIRARGSVYAMTQEDTPMTLIFRAREATSLLPTSAVRGSGDDRYVFVTEQNTAAFGGNTLKLHKMAVKVVGEYGGTTSIQDDITYYSIAYGEDRSINDGDAVMEYLN